jgi:MoxR-like ATPase
MLKIKITYPTPEEEREILEKRPEDGLSGLRRIVTPADIQRVRGLVKDIYMDDKIKTYILNLIQATRRPVDFKVPDLVPLIAFGASPRATLSLAQAARAYAFLKRRGYVTPEDVKAVGLDVLRHRVLLTYEAEAEGKTSEDIVKRIFDTVEVP